MRVSVWVCVFLLQNFQFYWAFNKHIKKMRKNDWAQTDRNHSARCAKYSRVNFPFFGPLTIFLLILLLFLCCFFCFLPRFFLAYYFVIIIVFDRIFNRWQDTRAHISFPCRLLFISFETHVPSSLTNILMGLFVYESTYWELNPSVHLTSFPPMYSHFSVDNKKVMACFGMVWYDVV